MSIPRPHPFDLIFGRIADDRFPAIRDTLGGLTDLDNFLLAAPALELLRDLRPESGLGDAVDDFVAFVHAAYLYWANGMVTATLDGDETRALCRSEQSDDSENISDAAPGTTYIQIAPRLVWGRLADEETFEPLDGWFASVNGPLLRLVACFGVHPDRPGLSVVGTAGERQVALARPDGSELFAPTMPGGDAAELFAVASPAELLLLAWRARLPVKGA